METHRPLISILIPVYNVERFLARCLDSVMTQSFTDFEVICVDDCSPDSCAAILQSYANADSRIRIITHPQNLGLMSARRSGYMAARGKYIFFLDSDDHIPPRALQALADRALQTDADIIVGEMYMENYRGAHYLRDRSKIAGNNGREYLRAILHGTTCSMCGSLFRTTLIQEHEYETLPHQTMSEDMILLTQIITLRKPTVGVVAAPTYLYFVNDSSASHTSYSGEKLKEWLTALMWIRQYLAKNYPSDEWQHHTDHWLLRFVKVMAQGGIKAKTLTEVCPEIAPVLRYSHMKEVNSALWAMNVQAMLHNEPYRRAYAFLRATARRILGRI